MRMQKVALVCIMLAMGIAAFAGQPFTRAEETAQMKTVLWEAAFSHPPYEYVGFDGAAAGLAVEMGRALLKDTPYRLRVEPADFSDGLPSSQPNSDAVVKLGFESLARQERLAASEPLMECRRGVYSRPNITQGLSLETLDDYMLGVVRQEYPYYRLLRESYANIRIFDRPEEAARALAANEIDLWMTERLTGHYALASLNALSAVRYHGELEMADAIVLLVNTDEPDFMAHINRRIRQVKKTPLYGEIRGRYMVWADGVNTWWLLFWSVLLACSLGCAAGALWWRRRYRRLENTLAQITQVYNKGKEKLQIAVANAQNGLFVFKNDSIPFLSEKLKELLLAAQATIASMEELIIQIRGMAHPSYQGLLLALQEKVFRAVPFHKTMHIRLLREGESEHWIYLCINAYPYQDGMVYAGYCQDVSKEKLLEQRLAFFEDHDHLTGLLNIRRFMQLGEQVLIQCAKTETILAAVFLDLCHFKGINHQYGQRYGDQILQQTAAQIQEILPHTSLFARMGGDKFIILLSHMERQQEALHFAAQMIQSIQAIECRALSVHANAGVAFFPEHGDSVVRLITCAEKAADTAKEKGPGQYAVYTEQE